MGIFFKKKTAPLTEEERLRAEAEEKEFRDGVRQLKERAAVLRENIRAVAEEKVFDALPQELFVRYAHIVDAAEKVSALVPAHYENKEFSFTGPVHALFLDERFVLAEDVWSGAQRFFSFRYHDLGKPEGKRGIFKSTLRIPCAAGVADGKSRFFPENGELVIAFYLKSEYRAFTKALGIEP